MISETLTYAAGVLVLVGGFALSGHVLDMTKPVSTVAPTITSIIVEEHNALLTGMLRNNAAAICPAFPAGDPMYAQHRATAHCDRFGY